MTTISIIYVIIISMLSALILGLSYKISKKVAAYRPISEISGTMLLILLASVISLSISIGFIFISLF